MSTREQLDIQAREATRLADPWVTVVWNDPVNLMSYVTRVFQEYFGLPRPEAEKHMREVHEKGRSVLSTGSREQMEVHVQAMHAYGLWATLERSGV
ncbi:ATP-dependent Clp protease adapter ClpS [Demequina soli]|uniref:ATP-dependent Clp protease adapter ClpS n=1 Tax=Demequina soli TaxID=1638987 RepID=UPI00078605EE|nr:ATP-dependent Clp protease adapter ClpS [Demequina soli]